eukprot:gene8833-biopygen3077
MAYRFKRWIKALLADIHATTSIGSSPTVLSITGTKAYSAGGADAGLHREGAGSRPRSSPHGSYVTGSRALHAFIN